MSLLAKTADIPEAPVKEAKEKQGDFAEYSIDIENQGTDKEEIFLAIRAPLSQKGKGWANQAMVTASSTSGNKYLAKEDILNLDEFDSDVQEQIMALKPCVSANFYRRAVHQEEIDSFNERKHGVTTTRPKS